MPFSQPIIPCSYTHSVIRVPHPQPQHKMALGSIQIHVPRHLNPLSTLVSLLRNGLGIPSSPKTSTSHTGTGGSSLLPRSLLPPEPLNGCCVFSAAAVETKSRLTGLPPARACASSTKVRPPVVLVGNWVPARPLRLGLRLRAPPPPAVPFSPLPRPRSVRLGILLSPLLFRVGLVVTALGLDIFESVALLEMPLLAFAAAILARICCAVTLVVGNRLGFPFSSF